MGILKRYGGPQTGWEIVGMGANPSTSDVTGVSSVCNKTGDVFLDAGDIEYDSTATYSDTTIGYKIQQATSIAEAYIANLETPYNTVRDMIAAGKVVYADVNNIRHYLITTSGTSQDNSSSNSSSNNSNNSSNNNNTSEPQVVTETPANSAVPSNIVFIANTSNSISMVTYSSSSSAVYSSTPLTTVFKAIYNTTTVSEIHNAANSGKSCIIEYGGKVYNLGYHTDTIAKFYNTESTTNNVDIEVITCSSPDSWSTSSVNVPYSSAITNLENSFTTFLNEFLDKTYPVGAYYWSTQSTSPASLFGGTWVKVSGRFVLADGGGYTAGGSGGEANVTLALTQIPAHRHATYYQELAQNYSSGTVRRTISNAATSAATGQDSGTSYAGGNGSGRTTAGSTSAHNNMPPYEVAYCWKRIA